MNEFDRGVLRQHFIDALPDCAIILLDAEGNMQTWNAGARLILGYAPDEIVGRHFSSLFSPADIAAARPAVVLNTARELDRHEQTERLVRKDGAEVQARLLLMPLYDRQKNLLGFGLLARDVTIATSPAAAVPADVAPHRPPEQILVVDDDEGVLGVAVSQLKSLGYRVIAASSGERALETLGRTPDVDLLFTDVSMPGGMGGRELAEKSLQIRPNLKVLFASGYFEGALVGKGDLESDARFLVKPYRKKELAQKIREVLQGTAP